MALKILHLEDNAADAELVKHALTRGPAHCDVKNVVSADAYERELSAEEYDVILSDSGIPGYDGRAALQRAHERCPGVPFIVVSGYIDDAPATLPHEPQPTARVSKTQLHTLQQTISSLQPVKTSTSASEVCSTACTPSNNFPVPARALPRSDA